MRHDPAYRFRVELPDLTGTQVERDVTIRDVVDVGDAMTIAAHGHDLRDVRDRHILAGCEAGDA